MLKFTVNERQGESFSVMLYASAMAICVLAITAILTVVVVKGGRYFWPTDIQLIEVSQGKGVQHYYGQLVSTQKHKDSGRLQVVYRVTDWQRFRSKSELIDIESPTEISADPKRNGDKERLLTQVAMIKFLNAVR